MTGTVPPYRLLLAGLGVDASDLEDADLDTVRVNTRFLRTLLREFAGMLPFDPDFYERSYPDVAAAVAAGQVESCHAHFMASGYREGRLPHAVAFDPAYYLSNNPDLAWLGPEDLERHYREAGYVEGRLADASHAASLLTWNDALAQATGGVVGRSIDSATIRAFHHPLVAPEPIGFRGGLVLGNGPIDSLLRHRRHQRPIDSFPPNDGAVGCLPGEHVYCGPSYGHFGHAMSEMIHRILPARAAFACRNLLFVQAGLRQIVAGFAIMPPVMQSALRFLDVQPEHVTVVEGNFIVERLHVAQQGSELPYGPSAAYLRMLSAYTPARLDALHDGRPMPARLYVSRSRLTQGGLLLGEAYLERLLSAEGWHILHPQDHALLDQMQAYHHAETIIFAGGSACHGTELFGAAGLRHCVLLPRGHAPRVFFDHVLRPRARRYDTLPEATLIGSIATDEHTGEILEHLGVSLLDLPALRDAMRALGLADLPSLDPQAYRAQAQTDLAAYLAVHARAAHPAAPRAVAALQARCAAWLGDG